MSLSRLEPFYTSISFVLLEVLNIASVDICAVLAVALYHMILSLSYVFLNSLFPLSPLEPENESRDTSLGCSPFTCVSKLAIPFTSSKTDSDLAVQFNMPGQKALENGVKRKKSAMKELFAGNTVLLVDDGFVRQTTSREIVNMATEALKVYTLPAAALESAISIFTELPCLLRWSL